MNRKTNIFYTRGNDSKFLTFDNYTESLTGDILATDIKLWPSRFLCINIPNLDKEDLIENALVRYYENKMAFLRDKVLEYGSENSESNDDSDASLDSLKPLEYLLVALESYVNQRAEENGDNGGIDDSIEEENVENEENGDQSDRFDIYSIGSENGSYNDFNLDICYVSDIIETNYNGTYTDIICTINPNNKNKISISNKSVTISNNEQKTYKYADDGSEISSLYGWDKFTAQEDPSSIESGSSESDVYEIVSKKPIFDTMEDNLPAYCLYTPIDTIDVVDIDDANGENGGTQDRQKNLVFNIIIPLFDVANIKQPNEITIGSTLDSSATKNVPLGIYFSDEPISLKVDDNGFSSNWSLMISMQFHAFPYSYDIQNTYADIESVRDAYVTFAEVLAKQTNFIQMIGKYNDGLSALANKVYQIQNQLNSMSTAKNVDEIEQNMKNLESNVNTSIAEIKNDVTNLARAIDSTKLKWQVRMSNEE